MSASASQFEREERTVPCVLPHFTVERGVVYDSTAVVPPRELTPLQARILAVCDGSHSADELGALFPAAATDLETLRAAGLLVFVPAARDRPQGPCWLVLSPHPDDAALSIGGTLAEARAARVWIATLATRTPSSVHPALDGSVERVSALRSAEDALCARYFGARWLGVGLDDAILEYRAPQAPNAATGAALRIRRFEAAIESVVNEVRPDLVLCPLGVGGHPDHEATHEAILRLRRMWLRDQRAITVMFYEDLPYAAADYFDVLQRIRRFEHAGTPLWASWSDLRARLDDKLTAISIYRSQAWQALSDAAARYASACGREMQRPYPVCERLWSFQPGSGRVGEQPAEEL